MKYFYNFLIGILIGFGAILPGVSSGVFCVIFGIYEKLLNSIVKFFKDIKNNFLFIFPIGLGSIVGVILLGNVIKYFFSLYQFQSCYVFIGLILGTIPALFKHASSDKYIDAKKIIPMIISFLIGIGLIILEKKIRIYNCYKLKCNKSLLSFIRRIHNGCWNSRSRNQQYRNFDVFRSIFNLYKRCFHHRFPYSYSNGDWSLVWWTALDKNYKIPI